jgi:hypothetical protein
MNSGIGRGRDVRAREEREEDVDLGAGLREADRDERAEVGRRRVSGMTNVKPCLVWSWSERWRGTESQIEEHRLYFV